jgi:hypothetical protein
MAEVVADTAVKLGSSVAEQGPHTRQVCRVSGRPAPRLIRELRPASTGDRRFLQRCRLGQERNILAGAALLTSPRPLSAFWTYGRHPPPAQRVAAEEGSQEDGPVSIPWQDSVVKERLRPLGVGLGGSVSRRLGIRMRKAERLGLGARRRGRQDSSAYALFALRDPALPKKTCRPWRGYGRLGNSCSRGLRRRANACRPAG